MVKNKGPEAYSRKNVYEEMSAAEIKKSAKYAEEYADYLNNSKTERDAVKTSVALAVKKGYKEYKFGDKLKRGGKYYYNNRGKALYLFSLSSVKSSGLLIAASHIDSPRLDIKPVPLYEDNGIAYFKTHYYGGIKKYQWTTVPLALHGVVCKQNGEKVEFNIGENENDPVFYVSDLLIHLASGQMQKKMTEGINAESLNVMLGSMPDKKPIEGLENEKVRSGIIRYLYDKYGITEEDLVTAELTCVPAYKTKDIGFDGTLLSGYGHDDKVCAYPSLTALLDTVDTKRNRMVILADKEETGSDGTTGMQTQAFTDIIDAIADFLSVTPAQLRAESMCLSADVNAGFDPNYADVFEKNNSSYIGKGVVLTKYTGSRGKYGTSDAPSEFITKIAATFNKAGVVWQTGELGKVDVGGGGTVAMYIAQHNIDTVDLGVPVLSMHAPLEVISKGDLYMTYKGIKAFFEIK